MGQGESTEAGEADGRVPAAGKPRDMSPPQLALFDGAAAAAQPAPRQDEAEGGAKSKPVHCYIALRGEIFDVTNADREALRAQGWAPWFGRNKKDASDDEVHEFRQKYHVLGKVIPLRDIGAAELAQGTGEPAGAPILIAARGWVWDVSSGAGFYGPGGGYHLFAGHNAQRALALMSLKVEDVANTRLDDLQPKDIKILDDWVSKFMEKYPLIGRLLA
jgi:hypothetical protein